MKNLIITGATRGLGLNHALYLSKEGYNLASIDISEGASNVYGEMSSVKRLISKLNKNNTRNIFYQCDLTDFKGTKKVFSQIFADYKNIHGCVFNAGGDVSGKSNRADGSKPKLNDLRISAEDNKVIMERNYLTCFNSIKAIAPYMKKQRFGSIVTTSSMTANQGVEIEISYSVAKTAVAQLTRSTALTLRKYGVNVNSIAPGGTLTGRFLSTVKDRSKKDREKIFSKSSSKLLKPADMNDISSVVSFLLSEKSSYVSGQVIRIDGAQSPYPI